MGMETRPGCPVGQRCRALRKQSRACHATAWLACHATAWPAGRGGIRGLPVDLGLRQHDRLVLDEPTDSPEGEVIYLRPIDTSVDTDDDLDDAEREALHAAIDDGIAAASAGDHTDAQDFVKKLLDRPRRRGWRRQRLSPRKAGSSPRLPQLSCPNGLPAWPPPDTLPGAPGWALPPWFALPGASTVAECAR